MTKENLVVASEDIQVQDGKVVISSEELAAAIQSQDVDLEASEELGFSINFACTVSAVK